MRRSDLSVGLLLGVLPLGCAAVAPVAGPAMAATGFSYSTGKATQVFAFPTATVQRAVVDSMDDLRIGSVRETHDAGSIIFEGTTADGRRAMVTLRPQQGATKLTARMGLWGDEPLSRALMDRVGVRLGSLPPEAIPDEPPSKPASNPFFSRSAVSDEVMLRTQAEQRYHDATLIP